MATTRTPRVPGAAQAAPSEPIPAAAPAEPGSDLPNAIDIDPETITGPVLTNQGWICPVDRPNPAARF